ncbi:MAG: Fic family protein [Thermodesulfovibrionales bacterium]|nr:Fic family protein [Thermodesulfovibrionales bacterium]
MKTYERTHPWLKFEADMRNAGHFLWMTLGEAISKCEHIAGVPLQPETAKKLHLLYLAKGIRATTAIEGNTLTEEEVLERLEGKLALPPSREYLGQEVDNIQKGCNKIFASLMSGESGDLAIEEIKSFNRIVLDGLSPGEDIVPGEIRNISVGVAGYRGAPAEDCEYLLHRMCEWLNGLDQNLFGEPMALGIVRAILSHLYIAWIHPFADGNGRTARLVEFKSLLAAGVPTAAAHLLSNHYNLTRSEYYKQLDHASKSNGDIVQFVHYALKGFVDGLRGQIQHIQKQQLEIAWRDFVYESFRDKIGPKYERRRNLALDISKQAAPVPFNKIREVSPRIAASYASKTSRTIRRDLLELQKIELIKHVAEGYVDRSDRMLSFLPQRRQNKN